MMPRLFKFLISINASLIDKSVNFSEILSKFLKSISLLEFKYFLQSQLDNLGYRFSSLFGNGSLKEISNS